MDNPVGNVAMLFTQYDLFRMTNDEVSGLGEEYMHNYMGILQFPKGISENWNIINRVVWNVPSLPLDQDKIDDFGGSEPFLPPGGGPSQPPSDGEEFLPVNLFSGRTTGFGDMYYVGLFSPKAGIKHSGGGTSVWGVGFDLSFPTASEDILGDGKWSAGPSALYVYLGQKWKVGGLAQQYFDFAGDGDRDSVNLTNLQYFIFYSLDEVTSIGAAPNIIINWEADSDDRYTVPIGLGISRTVQMGKVPVRFGLEFHYNVVRPDSVGADWNLRFYIIPAVPSAEMPTVPTELPSDFEIAVYQGEDVLGGQSVKFSEVLGQGKPVVLSLWAGLCPICRVEMPKLQKAYPQYRDRVLLVGIDIGPFVGLGTKEDGLALLNELGITYPTGPQRTPL